jgi:hypothetical protein
MLLKCFNTIDDDVTRSIFNNLEFSEYQSNDSYNKYIELDYSKYRITTGNQPSLELSPEVHILFYQLDQLKNEFTKASKAKQEKLQKGIHLFGYNISDVPEFIKLGIFVGVFAIFALSMIYLLSKVSPQDKLKKKKNRKNKQE